MVSKSKGKTTKKLEEEPSVESEQVMPVEEVILEAEPAPEPKPDAKPDDLVTVKVVKGSIGALWFDGQKKKGEVFTATRKQAESIDPSFIVVLE